VILKSIGCVGGELRCSIHTTSLLLPRTPRTAHLSDRWKDHITYASPLTPRQVENRANDFQRLHDSYGRDRVRREM